MTITGGTVSAWEFGGFHTGTEFRTSPTNPDQSQIRKYYTFRRFRFAKDGFLFTSEEGTTQPANVLKCDFGQQTQIGPAGFESYAKFICTEDDLDSFAPGSGIFTNRQEWVCYGPYSDWNPETELVAE